MESNCTLPTELIYRVIYFLSPQDIIRLRTVSKQFNAIAHDPTVWRSLYAVARLPRYPGPFPTQSTEFLQHTLIHSELLSKSWTTQPMRCVSRIEIQELELGPSTPFPQVINGRWVIGCELSRRFVVYDIDLRSSHVLWEKDPRHLICSWSAVSAATDQGLIVYIVFNDLLPTSPWKLLEFRVDSDSGHLYHTLTLDVPTRVPEETVCLDGKQTPFLHIVTQQLIFDARTKRFCEFPEFHSQLFQAPVNWNFIRTVLTKTHIIRIRRVFDPASLPVPVTLIQAFTPPADSREVGGGVDALHLSHEGTFHDASENFKTIRDSITDTAGRTTIRLLRQAVKDNVMHFSCIELALPERSLHTNGVLPVIVDSHDVGRLDCGPFRHRQHMTYIESSDDGHVRGFIRFSELNRRLQPVSADLAVKFTIDASGERCVATLGPVLATQIDKPFPFAHIWFDNVRGRLCFAKGGVVPRMRAPRDLDRAVVVMDVK